ncbi:16S rRNA (guanine(527)-N(7))-methyltransferase RsmG [Pelagicoccus sp. SDUM812003]|uniref:16S rRNA (guanine(527)-N(7))-methyltransferase RsmG n=1 Tax=Pelagicoccus sp. SDUM812003 TaxID=3041267 RepID=UPI00280DCF2F|nr:16S rRNA (guanine(527)-N(7))-methyltransferase RsmG [Pelagicoccus sp. SDUM812003]MDQ8204930.1 16S rRNA (guanine(527)-N(7))-methyltransferase RsmG [Pelagicoccus sp. SDUM812003]
MTIDTSIISQHFPELSELQRERFQQFAEAIVEWNAKINVISRHDVENVAKRHILHSLAIAKTMRFEPDSTVIDVGTGGGFPGVPLAILFPEVRFLLVDSIGKKIKVVQDCLERLELENAVAAQCRVEEVDRQVDFIVARAVTQLPKFMGWIRKKVKRNGFNPLPNGVLYLKGGDLSEEFSGIPETPSVHPIRDYFDYEEFDQKYVIHVPVKR